MLLQGIATAPYLTLALVHGACFGAGADIAVGCARRIAAPDARFRMPGLMFGVVLGTRRLAQSIGRDNASTLLLAEKPFGAAEALRTGFVTEVVEMSGWSDCIARCESEARALPLAGLGAMLRVTAPDTRDADLAELARSVAAPGLKSRLLAYAAEGKTRPGLKVGTAPRCDDIETPTITWPVFLPPVTGTESLASGPIGDGLALA